MALITLDINGERKTYPIEARGLRIGRALENDIVLNHAIVSRYHTSVSGLFLVVGGAQCRTKCLPITMLSCSIAHRSSGRSTKGDCGFLAYRLRSCG